MKSEPRTISRHQYLMALGLFTLAKSHSQKAEEGVRALAQHLGVDEGGHVMDAVYGYPSEGLDKALAKENISVEESEEPKS